MLRLIAGLLVLVPALAALGLALVLDRDPRSANVPDSGPPATAAAPSDHGIVNLQAAIELPPEYPRRYINIDLDAERTVRDGLPNIQRISVGAFDVSGWLANQAMRMAVESWPLLKDERLQRAAARAVQSFPDHLELDCDWPGTPVQHLRVRALPATDRTGTRSYAECIAAWTDAESGIRASVLGLLRRLLEEAAKRSATGADPVLENRSAILVATAHAFGCIPVAEGRPIRRVRPTLHRRDDLGRHFLASAALAALLDRELSESVGLDKEVTDAREFSGFSFSDIAANRAGARFGEIATASAPSARRVQQWMEHATSDTDIMPEVRDLPDHLPEEELKRRFGRPGEAAYQQVLDDIEARIAHVPLYRVPK